MKCENCGEREEEHLDGIWCFKGYDNGDCNWKKFEIDMDFSFRDATTKDSKFVYFLRFSEQGISVSLTKEKPIFDKHNNWFKNHYQEYTIIVKNNLEIGYLRKENKEISIMLIEKYQNKGIGTNLLKKTTGTATILLHNANSIKSFIKAGYKLKGYLFEK